MGGDQASWLVGGAGADRIYGGGGDEIISTEGNGQDTDYEIVKAGGGNDIILIGHGGADVDGGSGQDIIGVSGLSSDIATIRGGLGDDSISGRDEIDIFNYATGDGSDDVDGGGGVDRLNVSGDGSANAFVVSNADFDPTSLEVTVDGATSSVMDVEDIYFTGNGGNDTLTVSGNLNGTGLAQSTIHFDGGGNDDTLNAAALTSAHGVDFTGGDGNDTFIASAGGGNDRFDGGDGGSADFLSFQSGDRVDYSAVTTGVFVNVGAADATVDTGSGLETLVAGQARDRGAGTQVGTDTLLNLELVIGGSGDDVLVGGDQSNWLVGGAGADRIYGGDGNEFIVTDGVDSNGSLTADTSYDIVKAGGGNDVISVRNGGADVDGGSGNDIIIVGGAPSDINTISGGLGDDQIFTGADSLINIMNYTTGDGSDTVSGFGVDRLNVNGDGADNAFVGQQCRPESDQPRSHGRRRDLAGQ